MACQIHPCRPLHASNTMFVQSDIQWPSTVDWAENLCLLFSYIPVVQNGLATVEHRQYCIE